MNSKVRVVGGFVLGTMAAAMTGLLIVPHAKPDPSLTYRLRRDNLIDRLTRCRRELQDFIKLCRTNV